MEISMQQREGGSLSSPFFITQIALRAVSVLSTIVSIGMMVTSDDSITVMMVKFSAKYHYSTAFRFLLGADTIVCGLVLLSLIGVYLHRKKFSINHWFLLFLHDLVMAVLMIAACAAGSAIGYVALEGQNATGWFPICDRVGRFCRKIGVSIGFSYVAFVCLFALAIMSSYKLKSQSAS